MGGEIAAEGNLLLWGWKQLKEGEVAESSEGGGGGEKFAFVGSHITMCTFFALGRKQSAQERISGGRRTFWARQNFCVRRGGRNRWGLGGKKYDAGEELRSKKMEKGKEERRNQ